MQFSLTLSFSVTHLSRFSFFLSPLGAPFTRIVEMVEVYTAGAELHDWTSFQGSGRQFCLLEQERKIFFLDGAGIIFVDYEPRNLFAAWQNERERGGEGEGKGHRTKSNGVSEVKNGGTRRVSRYTVHSIDQHWQISHLALLMRKGSQNDYIMPEYTYKRSRKLREIYVI